MGKNPKTHIVNLEIELWNNLAIAAAKETIKTSKPVLTCDYVRKILKNHISQPNIEE